MFTNKGASISMADFMVAMRARADTKSASRTSSRNAPAGVQYVCMRALAPMGSPAAFSRWREYRADAGGADLAGRQKMIAALQRLQGDKAEPEMKGEFAAFGSLSCAFYII